jgi:triacylglycerol lipase
LRTALISSKEIDVTTLTPKQASEIAGGVYGLRTQSVSELKRQGLLLGCEGMFSVTDESKFQGKSGAIYKPLSGFGYLAEGEGPHRGEVLCVTRGTKTATDWLSNFNVGVQNGPSSHLVHAGFNEIFKSYSTAVGEFLRNRNPTHIHCVGHSLGGALAMLNADFFTARGVAKVSIYTFGAPRTGLRWFADELTWMVGAERIFRVSHIADPVPMIPILPFAHIPYRQPAYQIGARGGSLISVGAHSMATSYIPSVSGKSWGGLQLDDGEVSDQEVQTWLNVSGDGNSVLTYSAEALRMIGRFLKWLLKKALAVLGAGIGTAVTAGMTLLDQVAWMLGKGAELSKELASYQIALVRAILRFVGRVVGTAYDLTVAFLRWVLGLLFNAIASVATRALALV